MKKKTKLQKLINKVVPASRISYKAPEQPLMSMAPGGKLPKKLKWKNAPKYKIPATPKVSGRGWK